VSASHPPDIGAARGLSRAGRLFGFGFWDYDRWMTEYDKSRGHRGGQWLFWIVVVLLVIAGAIWWLR